jgi:hypothetical protein
LKHKFLNFKQIIKWIQRAFKKYEK